MVRASNLSFSNPFGKPPELHASSWRRGTVRLAGDPMGNEMLEGRLDRGCANRSDRGTDDSVGMHALLEHVPVRIMLELFDELIDRDGLFIGERHLMRTPIEGIHTDAARSVLSGDRFPEERIINTIPKK